MDDVVERLRWRARGRRGGMAEEKIGVRRRRRRWGEWRRMRVTGDAEDMGAAAADEIRLPRYPSRVLLEAYRVR